MLTFSTMRKVLFIIMVCLVAFAIAGRHPCPKNVAGRHPCPETTGSLSLKKRELSDGVLQERNTMEGDATEDRSRRQLNTVEDWFAWCCQKISSWFS
ncbi:hypothetical protein HOLleu_27702 [Holothuria leucospilota]|uniref:Secreted protein n=1 Tax=Holothuria leucospilota TaxID=206669 RepID=A0A9Q1BQT1_HOLLE|nr:hypothetical protein HOLleu_27702 [Holothuria leucospilota]